jgi:hypothetical protein
MESYNKGNTTYYAELNDEGLIEYSPEKLLQILVGDTVIFHINAGSPIANKSHLRINMPEQKEDNLFHKSTTTLRPLRKRPSIFNINETVEKSLARIEPTERPFGGVVTIEPLNLIEPDVGVISPVSNLSKVVLPTPEGPTIEAKDPFGSSNEMSLRTFLIPPGVLYSMCTDSTEMTC